jgi:DegV family protein with EDD domain
LAVTLSAAASGICSNVGTAARALSEEFPGAKIEIVDSQTYTMLYGASVLTAARLAQGGGANLSALAEMCRGQIAGREVLFVAETLEYLKKGGRINAATLILGNLLDVRPVMSVRGGLIAAVDKIRGTKKLYEKLAGKIAETGAKLAGTTVYVMQAGAEESAAHCKAILMERFQPKEVCVRPLGPTICAHTGLGVVAVIFEAPKRA